MFSLWLLGLAQAGGVSGTVFNGAGEPLGDVAVYVLDERLAYATTLSSAAGAYSFSGLPVGRFRVWAGPGSDMDAVSRTWPDEWDFCRGTLLDLGEESSRDELDFQLGTGGRLTGTVLDATGEAVVGARVVAEGTSSRVSGMARSATTDFAGNYAIVGLDGEEDVAESWMVQVSADGWPDQYLGSTYEEDEDNAVEVVLNEESAVEPISLLDGILVEGVVSGPEGPLEGVEIFAYSAGQITDVRTDEDGAYEVMGLPPGEVLIWGNLEGYALTYLGGEPAPAGSRDVLEEGEVATGVDLELPLESRLVGRLSPDGEEDLSEVTLLAYHESMRAGLGDQMEADGSFAAGRLHGSGYHLYIYAGRAGYVDDFVRDDSGEPVLFSLEAESDSEFIDVVLPRGAEISGRVTREGDPEHGVYGAGVVAIPADPNLRPRSATVERDGTYAFSGIVPGTYTLQVRFTPVCSRDGGYVWQWWKDALIEEDAVALELGEGASEVGLDFVLAVDDDLDGMSDEWEREHGLDTNLDDSLADPDGDGVSNLDEYLLGTDPMDSAGGCGCSGAPGTGGLWWAWLAPLLVRTRRLR